MSHLTFPNFVKLFWFAMAALMFVVPTTTGMIVALGLTSSIVVVHEWLNMVRVNDEMIDAFHRYQDAVNQRVSLTEEAVEGIAQVTRRNTANIESHTEELKRVQTTANFKELN